MSTSSRYPCQCCGFETLDEEPPGTFEICAVCGWEDEGVQDSAGANGKSLRDYQKEWERSSYNHPTIRTEAEIFGRKYKRSAGWGPLRPANMEFLCTIRDVFEVTGRSCVIIPDEPIQTELRAGDLLVVQAPSGRSFETSVHALEFACPIKDNRFPFSVPPSIKKAELEIGSRIFVKADASGKQA